MLLWIFLLSLNGAVLSQGYHEANYKKNLEKYINISKDLHIPKEFNPFANSENAIKGGSKNRRRSSKPNIYNPHVKSSHGLKSRVPATPNPTHGTSLISEIEPFAGLHHTDFNLGALSKFETPRPDSQINIPSSEAVPKFAKLIFGPEGEKTSSSGNHFGKESKNFRTPGASYDKLFSSANDLAKNGENTIEEIGKYISPTSKAISKANKNGFSEQLPHFEIPAVKATSHQKSIQELAGVGEIPKESSAAKSKGEPLIPKTFQKQPTFPHYAEKEPHTKEKVHAAKAGPKERISTSSESPRIKPLETKNVNIDLSNTNRSGIQDLQKILIQLLNSTDPLVEHKFIFTVKPPRHTNTTFVRNFMNALKSLTTRLVPHAAIGAKSTVFKKRTGELMKLLVTLTIKPMRKRVENKVSTSNSVEKNNHLEHEHLEAYERNGNAAVVEHANIDLTQKNLNRTDILESVLRRLLENSTKSEEGNATNIFLQIASSPNASSNVTKNITSSVKLILHRLLPNASSYVREKQLNGSHNGIPRIEYDILIQRNQSIHFDKNQRLGDRPEEKPLVPESFKQLPQFSHSPTHFNKKLIEHKTVGNIHENIPRTTKFGNEKYFNRKVERTTPNRQPIENDSSRPRSLPPNEKEELPTAETSASLLHSAFENKKEPHTQESHNLNIDLSKTNTSVVQDLQKILQKLLNSTNPLEEHKFVFTVKPPKQSNTTYVRTFMNELKNITTQLVPHAVVGTKSSVFSKKNGELLKLQVALSIKPLREQEGKDATVTTNATKTNSYSNHEHLETQGRDENAPIVEQANINLTQNITNRTNIIELVLQKLLENSTKSEEGNATTIFLQVAISPNATNNVTKAITSSVKLILNRLMQNASSSIREKLINGSQDGIPRVEYEILIQPKHQNHISKNPTQGADNFKRKPIVPEDFKQPPNLHKNGNEKLPEHKSKQNIHKNVSPTELSNEKYDNKRDTPYKQPIGYGSSTLGSLAPNEKRELLPAEASPSISNSALEQKKALYTKEKMQTAKAEPKIRIPTSSKSRSTLNSESEPQTIIIDLSKTNTRITRDLQSILKQLFNSTNPLVEHKYFFTVKPPKQSNRTFVRTFMNALKNITTRLVPHAAVGAKSTVFRKKNGELLKLEVTLSIKPLNRSLRNNTTNETNSIKTHPQSDHEHPEAHEYNAKDKLVENAKINLTQTTTNTTELIESVLQHLLKNSTKSEENNATTIFLQVVIAPNTTNNVTKEITSSVELILNRLMPNASSSVREKLFNGSQDGIPRLEYEIQIQPNQSKLYDRNQHLESENISSSASKSNSSTIQHTQPRTPKSWKPNHTSKNTHFFKLNFTKPEIDRQSEMKYTLAKIVSSSKNLEGKKSSNITFNLTVILPSNETHKSMKDILRSIKTILRTLVPYTRILIEAQIADVSKVTILDIEITLSPLSRNRKIIHEDNLEEVHIDLTKPSSNIVAETKEALPHLLSKLKRNSKPLDLAFNITLPRKMNPELIKREMCSFISILTKSLSNDEDTLGNVIIHLTVTSWKYNNDIKTTSEQKNMPEENLTDNPKQRSRSVILEEESQIPEEGPVSRARMNHISTISRQGNEIDKTKLRTESYAQSHNGLIARNLKPVGRSLSKPSHDNLLRSITEKPALHRSFHLNEKLSNGTEKENSILNDETEPWESQQKSSEKLSGLPRVPRYKKSSNFRFGLMPPKRYKIKEENGKNIPHLRTELEFTTHSLAPSSYSLSKPSGGILSRSLTEFPNSNPSIPVTENLSNISTVKKTVHKKPTIESVNLNARTGKNKKNPHLYGKMEALPWEIQRSTAEPELGRLRKYRKSSSFPFALVTTPNTNSRQKIKINIPQFRTAAHKPSNEFTSPNKSLASGPFFKLSNFFPQATIKQTKTSTEIATRNEIELSNFTPEAYMSHKKFSKFNIAPSSRSLITFSDDFLSRMTTELPKMNTADRSTEEPSIILLGETTSQSETTTEFLVPNPIIVGDIELQKATAEQGSRPQRIPKYKTLSGLPFELLITQYPNGKQEKETNILLFTTEAYIPSNEYTSSNLAAVSRSLLEPSDASIRPITELPQLHRSSPLAVEISNISTSETIVQMNATTESVTEGLPWELQRTAEPQQQNLITSGRTPIWPQDEVKRKRAKNSDEESDEQQETEESFIPGKYIQSLAKEFEQVLSNLGVTEGGSQREGQTKSVSRKGKNSLKIEINSSTLGTYSAELFSTPGQIKKLYTPENENLENSAANGERTVNKVLKRHVISASATKQTREPLGFETPKTMSKSLETEYLETTTELGQSEIFTSLQTAEQSPVNEMSKSFSPSTSIYEKRTTLSNASNYKKKIVPTTVQNRKDKLTTKSKAKMIESTIPAKFRRIGKLNAEKKIMTNLPQVTQNQEDDELWSTNHFQKALTVTSSSLQVSNNPLINNTIIEELKSQKINGTIIAKEIPIEEIVDESDVNYNVVFVNLSKSKSNIAKKLTTIIISEFNEIPRNANEPTKIMLKISPPKGVTANYLKNITQSLISTLISKLPYNKIKIETKAQENYDGDIIYIEIKITVTMIIKTYSESSEVNKSNKQKVTIDITKAEIQKIENLTEILYGFLEDLKTTRDLDVKLDLEEVPNNNASAISVSSKENPNWNNIEIFIKQKLNSIIHRIVQTVDKKSEQNKIIRLNFTLTPPEQLDDEFALYFTDSLKKTLALLIPYEKISIRSTTSTSSSSSTSSILLEITIIPPFISRKVIEPHALDLDKLSDTQLRTEISKIVSSYLLTVENKNPGSSNTIDFTFDTNKITSKEFLKLESLISDILTEHHVSGDLLSSDTDLNVRKDGGINIHIPFLIYSLENSASSVKTNLQKKFSSEARKLVTTEVTPLEGISDLILAD